MTSRIVHSYFSRFRHIIRQFRHFVFRIGSYRTDRACNSAISLRVAAKTRTKPTGAPSTVYRTNMPLTMACCRYDSIYSRSLREINPYTALMADMHIDGFDAYYYAARLETDARTLSRPNTDAPVRLGGNGLERNRRQDYNFYARTPA